MPQIDRARERTMKNCYNALTKVAVELKGQTLSDDETLDLSNRLHDLMVILYSQRSDKSKETTAAFDEAMKMLSLLRR